MPAETAMVTGEPAHAADPYPFLAGLRAQSQVCRVVIDGLPAWLMTTHHKAPAALGEARLSVDPERASDAARAVAWVAAITSPGLARHLLRSDPPDHTRLRRLVSQAFTPRRVAALRARIEQIAEDLIAGFLPPGR